MEEKEEEEEKERKQQPSGLAKWQRGEGGAAEVAVPHFLAQLAVEITPQGYIHWASQPALEASSWKAQE